MDDNTALDALAEDAGIATRFNDIWGREYRTSAETKQALLTALGIDVQSPQACERSLNAFREASWKRVVDAVTVIASKAQPGEVEIALADDQVKGGSPVDWALRLESGETVTGSVGIDELVVVDRHSGVTDRGAVTRYRMTLPDGLPEGYHSLSLSDRPDRPAETTLIVAPPRCWTPEDVTGDGALWGVSCQLYALRKAGDHGIGTFGHLAGFSETVARAGGDTVGLNPLHALFPVDPDQASPYSPSSRDFLNPLYIDVGAIPEAVEAGIAVPPAPADDLIDYHAVADTVFPALERAFAAFRERHPDMGTSDRAWAFRSFREEGGQSLHDFALFMAIQDIKAGDDPAMMPWWTWGDGFATPHAADSVAFAQTHRERVTFHQWCQFIADEQLAMAAERGREAGLRLGLYRDLAIGVGPASASAWAHPHSLVRGVYIGAPPDMLNRVGQDWGLAPLHPIVLREAAFRPLIHGLRANMRHAGAIRIDHVMGLMHQYWVPAGRPATEGTYVRYPFHETLRVLALESRRNKAIVIGEDLGTVPEGFRETMAAAGVLSYRVMPFERVENGLFARGSTYPRLSVCTYGTHDLPTVDGWWEGRDIQWRCHLALYASDEDRLADAGSRAADRRRLIDALIDAGVWPADRSVDTQTPEPMTQALRVAIHAFLARSSSALMVVQIEDALGMLDQMNLPGTVDGHPNWRRRLPCCLSELGDNPSVSTVFGTVATVRGRHGVV